MAGQEIRMRAEPVRTLDFSGVSGTYMGVGTGLSHPARLMWINNLTDAALMCSLDGFNDHFPIVAQGFLLLDITGNKTVENGFYLSEGDRLYVRSLDGDPTSGTVYLTIFYGSSS